MSTGERLLHLGLASALIFTVHTLYAAEAPTVEPALLSLSSNRPVADAMAKLTARYGYLITYEDPEFAYSDDIRDVTAEVRHDFSQHRPGKAPRALVPSGGNLTVTYDVVRQSGRPEDVMRTVSRVLDAQTQTGRGGVFRAERDGAFVHIVPMQVRDTDGNWIPQSSVLDVRISIPDAPRTGREMIAAICAAVSKQGGTPLVVGTGPSFHESNPPIRGAHDEVARDVLVRTLQSTNQRVVWRIFYGPDVKWKALNLRMLPQSEPLDATPVPRTAPSVGGSGPFVRQKPKAGDSSRHK